MPDANKIKYGIKNVYYAVATIDNTGAATYDTPVAIPGAVSISLSAQGENSPFYADNIVYYTTIANNGYEGDLEVARLPDSFYEDVLGNVVADNDLVYEDANASPIHFALMFQFEGDASARRHVMYNCVATRPDVAGSTKEDTITPETETLSITATSIYVSALDTDVVKAYLNEGDTGYSTFFSAVLQPTASAITT